VCGQRAETHIHSFGEFLREAFEGITHADSRVWRTLWPLLFRPGFLTREYFEGRRSRYLPPFRLYLVLSVLFFLVASAMPHRLELFDFNANSVEGVQVTPLGGAADAKETTQQRANRVCGDMNYQGPWEKELTPRFTQGCRKIMLDNGDGLAEGMLHNVPKALFVLLPVLALVMRLMYLRRYYVEHLLFFIHTHSFIFLLLLLFLPLAEWIQTSWISELIKLAVTLYIPWYVYRAMRRYYRQGRFATLAKYSVLGLAYLICAALMLVLTTFYTIMTL
jgi:hypothetical protein